MRTFRIAVVEDDDRVHEEVMDADHEEAAFDAAALFFPNAWISEVCEAA